MISASSKMLSTESSVTESSSKETESECSTYGSIIPAIKRCNTFHILVCGINQPDYKLEQNTHHMRLLSGIVGKEIPLENTNPRFSFELNKVQVTIHFRLHPECQVTDKDIDLLILFLPISNNEVHQSYSAQLDSITRRRGANIWKHSVVILTGVDMTMNEPIRRASSLERQVQQAIKPYSKCKVEVSLAGRPHDHRNLLEAHEKWFSKLWQSCFLSSRIKSMPALLKIAQGRITNKIESKNLFEVSYYRQPIEVPEDCVELPKSVKATFGIGGGGAIAGAAAAGATTGALIGALAIGIPSFGVAAGAGLAIGGVVGGGIGAGIAGAAVGKGYQLAKERQLEVIDTADLGKYYTALLSRIPRMCKFLSDWAEKQINCKMVVAGIEGECVSKTAAALIGIAPRRGGSGLYWKQVFPGKTNLIVQDFSCISENATDRHLNVQELSNYYKQKKMHLLIFCLPITLIDRNNVEFAESAYADYLKELYEEDSNIFSNMAIVLTHADELLDQMRRHNVTTTFQQYFKNLLRRWKEQVKRFLDQVENCFIEHVPVLPAGSVNPSIDLSDQNQASPATHVQYHWLSELLLQVMSVTKADGLPALIKTNKKRMHDSPDQYPNPESQQSVCLEPQQDPEQPQMQQREHDRNDRGAQDEFREKGEPEKNPTTRVTLQNASQAMPEHQLKLHKTPHELIVEAQCSMFTQIGLREKRHPGEAIGLILGVREEQHW